MSGPSPKRTRKRKTKEQKIARLRVDMDAASERMYELREEADYIEDDICKLRNRIEKLLPPPPPPDPNTLVGQTELSYQRFLFDHYAKMETPLYHRLMTGKVGT